MPRKSKAFLKRSAAAKLGWKRHRRQNAFELREIEKLLGEDFIDLKDAREALREATKKEKPKRKTKRKAKPATAAAPKHEYAITFHYDKGKDKKGRIKYFNGELRFFSPKKLSEEDAEEKGTEIITGNIPNRFHVKAFVYEHSPEGRKIKALESDIEKGDYIFAEEFEKTVKRITGKGSKTRTRKGDLT